MTYGAEASLPIGTVVHERYQVVAIVGQGGLGTVYRVTDTLFSTGNIFALKELSDRSPGARRQFEQEAQWLQALDHNSIPKVREFFPWNGRLYLVMDFVEGENLEQKLVRHRGMPLAERDVLAWILLICDALFYLHTRMPPILHRDVKPANIIVTPGGHPVLVDLGIAKEHLPGAHQTNTFVRKAGTEGYAPPEQYSATGKTGPWSDVYGLGATLYQLLTGRVPPTAVERVALDTRFVRPGELNRGLSPHVDAAICRALAVRPAERFQSVAEFTQALLNAPPDATGVQPQIRTFQAYPSILPPTPPGPQRSAPAPVSYSRASIPGAQTGQWRSLPSTALPSRTSRVPLSPARPPSSPHLSKPSVAPPSHPAMAAQSGRGASGALSAAGGGAAVQATPAWVSGASEEQPSRRRLLHSPFSIAIGIALVGVIAVVLGIFVVGLLSPPDRSTPQASVNGYYAALSHQDYARAWQYMSANHNDPGSQSNFQQQARADDAQEGHVLSVRILQVTSTTSAQVYAVVTVQRSVLGSMRYTLTLTQYDENTWLIDSITEN